MTTRATGASDFTEFVAARTPELHRTAYLLMGDQENAERLVAAALRQTRQHSEDLGRAGSTTRLAMARLAARLDSPTSPGEPGLPGLSPRQRAVLLLRAGDGLDLRSTAKELRLSRAITTAAERAAEAALGSSITDRELRSQLDDFAERATWPDPAVTLEESTRSRPRGRRPRWTYAAALLVIVASAASVTTAQVAHNRWLRTPAGLNAAHGTHFPEYTQGYKLVEIRDLRPKKANTVRLPSNEVYVVGCPSDEASGADSLDEPVTVNGATDNAYTMPCQPQRDPEPRTIDFVFSQTTDLPTQLEINQSSKKTWPLAIYRQVNWDEYPVATKNFDTSAQSADSGAMTTDANGKPIRPVSRAQQVSMSSGPRVNGTFTATLRLPAPSAGTQPTLEIKLTPSTTGQFRLLLDGVPTSLNCGPLDPSEWCSVYDRKLPVLGGGVSAPSDAELISTDKREVEVRLEVRHALGPWKLHLDYSRYKVDKDGAPVSP